MTVQETFNQLHINYPEFQNFIIPVQWAIAAMVAPEKVLLLDLDLPLIWAGLLSMVEAWGIEA